MKSCELPWSQRCVTNALMRCRSCKHRLSVAPLESYGAQRTRPRAADNANKSDCCPDLVHVVPSDRPWSRQCAITARRRAHWWPCVMQCTNLCFAITALAHVLCGTVWYSCLMWACACPYVELSVDVCSTGDHLFWMPCIFWDARKRPQHVIK